MSTNFTTIVDQSGTHTLRHTWTVEDARTGIVDAFLDAAGKGLSERPFGETPTMRIQGSDGDTEAVLLHPEHLERLQAAADELHHLKATGRDRSKAWEPFVVGPFAEPDGNRLIPHEPLHDPIARMFAKQLGLEGPDSLDADQRTAVELAAIMATLHVRLDADADGVVPVLMWSDWDETPGHGPLGRVARWQLAWTTPAPGLFVRSRGAWILADYSIVTGSGIALRTGYSSRETATAAAVRVHEAAPGIDWFVTTTRAAWDDDTVAAVKAALVAPRPVAGDR